MHFALTFIVCMNVYLFKNYLGHTTRHPFGCLHFQSSNLSKVLNCCTYVDQLKNINLALKVMINSLNFKGSMRFSMYV